MAAHTMAGWLAGWSSMPACRGSGWQGSPDLSLAVCRTLVNYRSNSNRLPGCVCWTCWFPLRRRARSLATNNLKTVFMKVFIFPQFGCFRNGLARLPVLAVVMALVLLTLTGAARAQEQAGEAAGALDADTEETALGRRYAARETGLRALSDGLHESAARFFVRYRDLTNREQPDFADATILLITAHYKDGRIDRADQAFAHYIESRPDAVQDAYYRDKLTYWRARLLEAQGRFRETVEALQPTARSAATPEFRAKKMVLLGDAYAQLGQWPQAEDVYMAYLEAFPAGDQIRHVRTGLVQVYLATEQFARAAALLDTIREHDGDDIVPRLTLYRIMLDTAEGRLDAAVQGYQTIRPDGPPAPEAVWWTALSPLVSRLFEAGRHELVVDLAREAEAMAPDSSGEIQMRLRLAESLVALERIEDAIGALEQFERDFPNTPQAVPVKFKLAQLLRKSEHYQRAEEYFNSVASNADAPASLRYRAGIERGWCLVDAARYDAAVQAFSRTAKLGGTDSEKANATFLAGETAFRMEDFTGAAMLYQNTADQYPETEFAEDARFMQAKARANANLPSDAALVYRQFLEEFPDSDKREQATLERGVALKDSGSWKEAMTVLSQFVDAFPDSRHAPRALIEAHASAKASGAMPDTIDLLTRLIDNYPDSDLFPHALYQRAHVNFLHGNVAAGLIDGERFVETFPELPMAADVLTWIGDYHANAGDLTAAEDRYLQVVSSHPRLPQAQIALYEAARSAHSRGDTQRAKNLARQLFEHYEENPSPGIHARTRILFGDILAQDGEYAAAHEHFAAAAAQTGETAVKFAAIGRTADMLYSMSSQSAHGPEEQAELRRNAAELYEKIVNDDAISADVRESARYRLAKVHEKSGNLEAAIDQYLEIVYQYDIDLKQGTVRDWYYFARSGYDVARLLAANDDYEHAARVYERLYDAGIPTADDARQRAVQIRRRLAAAPERPASHVNP